MSLQEKQPIVITNDLDGVHIKAPTPLTTLRKLLTRQYKIPYEIFEVTPYASPTSIIGKGLERITAITHRNRRINPEGISGLRTLSEIAQAHKREIHLMALSGRIKPVHQVTHQDLGPQYEEIFVRWLLNESTSSAMWKEYKARQLISEGFTVVHLEDDLNPALRMARIKNVHVYLFRNFSNNPWLLKWAGIELPENVIPVRSFEEVNTDFNRKLLLDII